MNPLRPTAICTYINYQATQESRSRHSDLEPFEAQQSSIAYGLSLGLRLGLALG